MIQGFPPAPGAHTRSPALASTTTVAPPAPPSRGGPRFSALLAPDAQKLSDLEIDCEAAGFSETGVFGRGGAPAQAADARTTGANSMGPTTPRANSLATDNQTENADVTAAASPATAGARAPRSPHGSSPEAQTRQHSETPSQALATFTTAGAARSGDTAANKAMRVRAQLISRLNQNPLQVSVRATDQGLVVFARVGRMSTTQREELRESVRALLRELGAHDADINIVTANHGEADG